MFITHDEVKLFVSDNLEHLTNWSFVDVESPFFQGKRVDLLAHDGAQFVVVEIKLHATKTDIEQVVEYAECAAAERQNIRVALFAVNFGNVFHVPDGIELWRIMMALDYDIHRGIPRYMIQKMSVAPYNLKTRRIDDRFIGSSQDEHTPNHKTRSSVYGQSAGIPNPFLRR